MCKIKGKRAYQSWAILRRDIVGGKLRWDVEEKLKKKGEEESSKGA